MTAKYATTCGVCSVRIRPGEEIARSGSTWAHTGCAGAADAPAEAEAGKAPKAAAKAPRAVKAARPDMPAPDGALEAVRALDGPLVVVSDSTYVVNCFRDGWWRGWLARGWTTSAKKPVVSRDLWEPLITLVEERGDVSFRWVKGHSGDDMNDLVDALAVEQSQKAA